MSMSEPSAEQGSEKQQDNLQSTKQVDIFAYSEVREVVKEIPALIRENMNAKYNTTIRMTKYSLFWVSIIVLIIIGSVTLLTRIGKLPPEVISFLFGTIVGSIFTFAFRLFKT